MPLKPNLDQYKWLNAGNEIFPAMLAALKAAEKSICLEVYIFSDDVLGREFLEALTAAAQRGVKVRVMVDAFGSILLPGNFWEGLIKFGGQVRVFNPFWLKSLGFRDHRKMLVCDDTVAFAGGFNISHEYSGDGVKSGWGELGVEIRGSMVGELQRAFDEIFQNADAEHPKLGRRAHPGTKGARTAGQATLLLGGPGLMGNPFKSKLVQDLSKSHEVNIISAYFLPTTKIRRALLRVVRRGGRVRLILPAKSDVTLSRLATHSLYRRLLKRGVEIYEYQPQVLHTKLVIVDQIVYAGSSNLDPRSLLINYELMLRIVDAQTVYEARLLFEEKLKQSKRILHDDWVGARTWWARLKGRWAHFLVARLDPLMASWQLDKEKRK